MLDRREFLKLGATGVATLVVGDRLGWVAADAALAIDQTLRVTITDAVKEMVTHNEINTAECYFWLYKMSVDGVDLHAECPGPTIVATRGDMITLEVTNDLDEPHAFFVPGMVDSGPIAPGETVTVELEATKSGAFLYYDNLNAPVNRMMGLHGALIVMPSEPSGEKFTPYDTATAGVQGLFDDLGSSAHFPGLAWEERDPATGVPPFRQYVWLLHEASSVLFREVGSLPAGEIYPAEQFIEAFLRDPFVPTREGNRIAGYFTINGQSGFFGHHDPTITPFGRVGEPVVIHVLNAGLWTHSLHLHANHFYITSVNDEVQRNPVWLDVRTIKPLDRVDLVVPFTRPPDVPNVRGIGMPDMPLISLSGTPVWPPVEEFNLFVPAPGEVTALAEDGVTEIDLATRMSPLCYPMHDHSEPTQTAQGGNYNMGLMSGMFIIGDRNTPGHMDFPIEDHMQVIFGDIRGVRGTEPAAGAPLGEHHEHDE